MNPLPVRWHQPPASGSRSVFAACFAATLGCCLTASGQAVDALLDTLVQKGILTVEESNKLKEESDAGFTKAHQVKTGLPDWVTSLKIGGDFRGRYEHFDSPNPINTDRDRFRYRVRLGFTVAIKDDFEVGLRLASADATGSFGGNPVSANTTFQDGSSRKGVYMDAAFARWTPIHDGTWTLGGTIGKMDNPFQTSNMVLDPDYQPEGAAVQAAYKINDHHTLKFNSAAFMLDELNQSTVDNPSPSHDPYFYGGQMLWVANWSKRIETTLGVSAFSIVNTRNLDNATVPNVNDGNTRTGAGILVHSYNPIIGSGAITYKLESFPLYQGEFPLRFGGEYMVNPAVSSDNTGYWIGLTLGKAGKAGTWDVSYRYQFLDADAWYEEVVDDDNSGFYEKQRSGSGFANANNPNGYGIRGGTNVKGHLVKVNYSFTDAVTLSLIWYHNEVIHPNPAASESGANHFMADINFKF